MSKERKDLISGAIFLFFGIGLLVWIIPNAITDIDVKYAGPKDFPIFISVCMILLGGVLVFQKFRTGINKAELKDSLQHGIKRENLYRLIAFGIIVLIYIFMAEVIGYLVSTIIVSLVLLILLKEKNKYYYFITVAVVLVLYYMFTRLLFVELP